MSSSDLTELLSKLTLEEKVSLLSGADGWQTQEISHLGIGSLKTTDGPAGARGALSVNGPTAAFLHSPIAQAATWSKSSLYQIGKLLSREAKTKSAQVLLAPTICCARNPLGGRNFECLGEDPVLTGSLAREYVKGVQEGGEVGATVKHFVANEQEFQRFTINTHISPAALREIYLKPFEMVVKSAHPPTCVMSAYNCVNGRHMDMSPLLQNVLRDEWGFEDLVMSDWGGTNSTVESVLAGCDLEMPGPPEKRGKKLLEALTENLVPDLLKEIDKSALRVLKLLDTFKLLGLTPEEATQTRKQPETSSTTSSDLQLVRSVAAESIVLLKNDIKLLPLKPEDLQGKKIAIIGPNSKFGTPGGGGSATMNPQYQTQPLDSLVSILEEKSVLAEVVYEPGALTHKWLPLVTSDRWSSDNEGGSLKIEFFATDNCSGEAIETQYRSSSLIDLFDSAPRSFYSDPSPHSLRITSTLTPLTSGLHEFELSSVGNAKLFIHDHLLIDNFNWTETGETFYCFGSVAKRASLDIVAGEKYEITIEASSKSIPKGSVTDDDPIHVFGVQPSVRIGFMEQQKSDEEMIADAVAAAKDADVVVCVIGLNDEWESEGYDRQSMSLPGSQDALIWALIKESREKLVVVNQSGSPVHMPWADNVSTIVQAWYGGQEAGNALWDVLFGDVNPSGRLPISWPREYKDLGFEGKEERWPGKEGVVKYDEGTAMGYRWYQKEKIEPRWWLGYGLGYGHFGLVGSAAIEEDEWKVKAVVHNVGDVEGCEIVQVYSSVIDRVKELRAFEKTELLQPGEEQSLIMSVRPRDLAKWKGDEAGRWVTEAGKYVLWLGRHAGDENMLEFVVTVAKTLEWKP
ncbi:related to beta-glucosidase [Phialocephala subalpina]|uniref:beta-glucosidase n=1 Tax=Phialocephala subalpina TaxID=576137 RepID=A0A1L7WHS0_9HELO|nr:related to beta-glucosidase [Phialocephala subalpina]